MSDQTTIYDILPGRAYKLSVVAGVLGCTVESLRRAIKLGKVSAASGSIEGPCTSKPNYRIEGTEVHRLWQHIGLQLPVVKESRRESPVAALRRAKRKKAPKE